MGAPSSQSIKLLCRKVLENQPFVHNPKKVHLCILDSLFEHSPIFAIVTFFFVRHFQRPAKCSKVSQVESVFALLQLRRRRHRRKRGGNRRGNRPNEVRRSKVSSNLIKRGHQRAIRATQIIRLVGCSYVVFRRLNSFSTFIEEKQNIFNMRIILKQICSVSDC